MDSQMLEVKEPLISPQTRGLIIGIVLTLLLLAIGGGGTMFIEKTMKVCPSANDLAVGAAQTWMDKQALPVKGGDHQ